MPEEMAIPSEPEPMAAPEPVAETHAAEPQADANVVHAPRRWSFWNNAAAAKPVAAPGAHDQQHLAVEPEDRVKLSASLDPEIDNIPAFLRRQAN